MTCCVHLSCISLCRAKSAVWPVPSHASVISNQPAKLQSSFTLVCKYISSGWSTLVSLISSIIPVYFSQHKTALTQLHNESSRPSPQAAVVLAATARVPSAGASLTASYDGTIEQEQVESNNNAYQITVGGSLTATSPSDSTHTILLAYFGSSLASAVSSGTAYPLVAGVPADGCSPLSYPYKLPGKVVLLARGNCTYQTKVGTVKEHNTCSKPSCIATQHEQVQGGVCVCVRACVCVCVRMHLDLQSKVLNLHTQIHCSP